MSYMLYMDKKSKEKKRKKSIFSQIADSDIQKILNAQKKQGV